ncbi:Uncharacterised protein [uncultured archaeon]|nr:Uncharacterised protein [uncultured archaeon]
MQNFYLLKPCKTSAAYEAVPKNQHLRLNLTEAAEKLKREGYLLTAETPVLFIAEKEFPVTVFPHGKLLIKNATEEGAQRLADDVYRILGITG